MNKMFLYPVAIGIVLGTGWLLLRTREEWVSNVFDSSMAMPLIFASILVILLDIVLIVSLMGGGK